MNDLNRWWLACIVLIGFVVLGELFIMFRDYLFGRMGINRNFLLATLWLMPAIVAFYVVRYSTKNSFIVGLSLIPVLSVLGPLVHLICGKLGATVDFKGVESLRVTFQIYFFLGSVAIGLGCIAGSILKIRRESSEKEKPGSGL